MVDLQKLKDKDPSLLEAVDRIIENMPKDYFFHRNVGVQPERNLEYHGGRPKGFKVKKKAKTQLCSCGRPASTVACPIGGCPFGADL